VKVFSLNSLISVKLYNYKYVHKKQFSNHRIAFVSAQRFVKSEK